MKLLANETRLAILRELGGERKSISEIGEKLAISNALMTKHIKKIRAGTIDQIRKRNGKRLEKEVSSFKD